jgi:hypothetical protein
VNRHLAPTGQAQSPVVWLEHRSGRLPANSGVGRERVVGEGKAYGQVLPEELTDTAVHALQHAKLGRHPERDGFGERYSTWHAPMGADCRADGGLEDFSTGPGPEGETSPVSGYAAGAPRSAAHRMKTLCAVSV